jgi:hypothetical protein
MKPLFAILIITAAIFTGCTFETRTNVAALDSTPRAAKTGDIEVFLHGNKPTRAYKEIALYSLASHGGEEAYVLQGFIQLAKKQGADGILFDDSKIQLVGGRDNIKDGGVGTFQGVAIIWVNQK